MPDRREPEQARTPQISRSWMRRDRGQAQAHWGSHDPRVAWNDSCSSVLSVIRSDKFARGHGDKSVGSSALEKLWNGERGIPSNAGFPGRGAIRRSSVMLVASAAGTKAENRTRQTTFDATGEPTHVRDEYARRQVLRSKDSGRAFVNVTS